MKGRTDREGSDRSQDTDADTTSRWGGSESQSDGSRSEAETAGGNHGSVQGRSSGLSLLRASCPSLIGTAVYGPVRTVVWDPWLAL
jgi:hypothetical protein